VLRRSLVNNISD